MFCCQEMLLEEGVPLVMLPYRKDLFEEPAGYELNLANEMFQRTNHNLEPGMAKEGARFMMLL